jgi:hypothetical protein
MQLLHLSLLGHLLLDHLFLPLLDLRFLSGPSVLLDLLDLLLDSLALVLLLLLLDNTLALIDLLLYFLLGLESLALIDLLLLLDLLFHPLLDTTLGWEPLPLLLLLFPLLHNTLQTACASLYAALNTA